MVEGVTVAHVGSLIGMSTHGSRVGDTVLRGGFSRLFRVVLGLTAVVRVMASTRIVVATVPLRGHLRHFHRVLHVMSGGDGPLRLIQMAALRIDQGMVRAEAASCGCSASISSSEMLGAVGARRLLGSCRAWHMGVDIAAGRIPGRTLV